MEKWIDSTVAAIEAGRAEADAPATLPARDLATALNLMNERALFASFTDEQPSIAQDQLVDTLAHIWVTQHLRRGPVICHRPMRTYVRVGHAPPSCTLISTRSTRRSSSATTPRCAAGR